MLTVLQKYSTMIKILKSIPLTRLNKQKGKKQVIGMYALSNYVIFYCCVL